VTRVDEIFEICALADLPDPGSRGFEVEDIEGFVVRRGESVHAYVDRCPHTNVPLAWSPNTHLDAKGELLQCSMHGALFLPDTGECVHGPCLGRFLTPLPVLVRGGRVLIRLDDLPEID
jgi:nitrite reductase/ring-hydroxylating ferredoxin subunit